MGQNTETCNDSRSTEVSVIRFVTRNRTIEEISPKKEVYVCKQRGCGKIFTNVDEYKTHEALEALKIKFICREPGCGEEVSDPGSMWRHYQEMHNSETEVFACPYTNCTSVHDTSISLEEHMEKCHRQASFATEPEVIYFEDIEDKELLRSSDTDNRQNSEKNPFDGGSHFELQFEEENIKVETKAQRKEDCTLNRSNEIMIDNNYPKSYELSGRFLSGNQSRCKEFNNLLDGRAEKSNVVFISSDVTITKNMKIELTAMQQKGQEHRIDLGNLEKVFRSGFERDSPVKEETANENNSNCSEDEEYTPKKQRMSRFKDSYKCDVNGCGKMYKYTSHYRHHQESHKLPLPSNIASSVNVAKLSPKQKQAKASTVSFFLCKMPGCGAQLNNVTSLWKHYQDNHANAKPPLIHSGKSSETFRCKVFGCDLEFSSATMLCNHLNSEHLNNSSDGDNINDKTGGSSLHFETVYQDDSPAHHVKTDYKAKLSNASLSDYNNSGEQIRIISVKEEIHD